MSHTKILTGILAYLTSFVLSSTAVAVTYSAPFDESKWVTNSSPLQCTLSHEIPSYGQARFSQRAGQRQTFALSSTLGRLVQGEVDIRLYPPVWNHRVEGRPLGVVQAERGAKPLALKKRTVYQLLHGLELGKAAHLIFAPSNISFNPEHESKDRIVLNPTGFKLAYNDYLTCIDDLVPYTYDELRKTTIRFISASKALSDEDERKLKAIGQMVASDKDIYKVMIEGHSDSIGSFTSNRQLSLERAWHIKDHLVNAGVDPKLTEIKGWGDRKPLAKNTTKKGRELNRRVEIQLYR